MSTASSPQTLAEGACSKGDTMADVRANHHDAKVPTITACLGQTIEAYKRGGVTFPLVARALEAFAMTAVLAERERCARVCEDKRDFLLSLQSAPVTRTITAHPSTRDDPCDRDMRLAATLGADACADAIRKG
jgi:hypothetical protein